MNQTLNDNLFTSFFSYTKATDSTNGVSQGYGDRTHTFVFTFPNISYHPGTIRAVGYDTSGTQTCETSKSTAGEASDIRLTVHTGPNGLRATGDDMVLVDAEVVDSNFAVSEKREPDWALMERKLNASSI